MLRLRTAKEVGQSNWFEVEPGKSLSGLCEDTDYIITLDITHGTRLYIDDVELRPSASGEFQWRPNFYAGRVIAEVTLLGGGRKQYWLDVSPTKQKSSEPQFEEMVTAIREFDTRLLGGASAAVMGFGREGQAGLFSNDILLSRVRAHGGSFLDAVDSISRAPHLSISADSQVLPLSRIQKLHPSALHDRRLVALATGNSVHADAFQTIQLRSVTSSPTFDTPANQTLLALLKRFRATVVMLREKVETGSLGIQTEDQDLRVEHRLHALDELETRAGKLILGRPFSETSKAQTSSSGLTQIAAQPNYSKAYRLGSRALALGVDGADQSDDLHVANSWGIYETWCYLAVLECINGLVGGKLRTTQLSAVSAQLAYSAAIDTSCSLEVLFQATFPSISPSQGRLGYSISKKRIPDIVLISKIGNTVQSIILDSKWRSGKENVLDAMQSAHIYHDSLRVDNQPPSSCILLFPGNDTVPELEQEEYISAHGVGAISNFNIGMPGLEQLRNILCSLLTIQTK
jgi:hypothetical protein